MNIQNHGEEEVMCNVINRDVLQFNLDLTLWKNRAFILMLLDNYFLFETEFFITCIYFNYRTGFVSFESSFVL